MDRTQPRHNDGKHQGRPLSPTLTDYAVQAQGGTTTAFDTMYGAMPKAAIPMEDRIIELTRENGRLRREIGYYKSLVKEVLHPVMALVQFHVHGLDAAVRRFNAKIEQSNSHWQIDPE